MKKVSLVLHQNYVENVIKNLHEAGLMEIIDISLDEQEISEGFEKAPMHSDSGLCTNYELRLTRLIDILKGIRSKKSGIKAILHPKLPEITTVEDIYIEDIYSLTEGILGEIEKGIIDKEKKINEIVEKIEDISLNIKSLNYIKDFDLDISDIGKTDYVIVKVGKTYDLSALEREINNLDKATIYYKQFGKGKKVEWSVLIAAHISEEDKIEKICREKITEFDLKKLVGTPEEALKSQIKEKKNLNKEKRQIIFILRDTAEKQLHELLVLREQIKLERIRKEISKNFAQTNSTYIIEGWVLEKNENDLQKLVSKVSKDHVICNFEKPSQNPDNPPTYMEMPKWAGSFRTLLELFATPKYNEINPAIIMGIFFILFFGIMLGDIGYGLIIFFLSLFGYLKFSKYNTMIKDWSFIGIWLGMTTIIVGAITNSFFGDLIPRFIFQDVNQTLYSITIGGIHFPIEPIRDPLTILIVALIFGLIHLNIGILLAIYQCYKNKDYKSLMTKHFTWILLQIGGGALIGEMLLHIWILGAVEFYISIIFVIIGIILLLLNAGPLGLFDITGFIGDWLSYARLLALGLGTTGMALAFNVVGEIIPDIVPVVGVILVPIILIVTHLANLGIQTLGAGVHSLRLQYVEFFNRFYEGGGEKFKPFSIKRRYTKLKR